MASFEERHMERCRLSIAVIFDRIALARGEHHRMSSYRRDSAYPHVRELRAGALEFELGLEDKIMMPSHGLTSLLDRLEITRWDLGVTAEGKPVIGFEREEDQVLFALAY